MEKGYVYIARIIDHGGKFVNGYHKIGLSKQYKVRETQLNSTHLPFDVLMVRVFESEDMRQLEGLFHVCFEDYRVVKEYDYRKNITTEWFDVTNIDIFNERIDKFIDLLGVNEIDINDSIDNDKTLTQEEKDVVKNNIETGKQTLRREMNYEFWSKYISYYRSKDNLYDTVNPGRDGWISKRLTGLGGLNCVVSGGFTRVELYIDLYSKEKNENVFHQFENYKSQIENEFGEKLKWEQLPNKKVCRISYSQPGNIYDKTKWDEMVSNLTNDMIKISKIFMKYSEKIKI